MTETLRRCHVRQSVTKNTPTDASIQGQTLHKYTIVKISQSMTYVRRNFLLFKIDILIYYLSFLILDYLVNCLSPVVNLKQQFLPRDALQCKALSCDRMLSVHPSIYLSVCLSVCDVIVLEQKLLWRAYRKSYMRNRLVPKWMTLTFV